MRIGDLAPADGPLVRQAAELLVDVLPNGWPTVASALKEVSECLAPERVCRVAVEDETLLGWIGALKLAYPGGVWELHPLAVRRDRQRSGIGTALVADLEDRVRERGGVTMWVGSDDDRDQTSLAGIDLYPDPLAHLTRIRNLRGHAFEFYQKVGYAIVGVVPDANGFGKPDIYLAKRIATPPR